MKKNLWRNFVAGMLVAALILTATVSYLKTPYKASAAEEGLDYAVVRNVAQFRQYIDNSYPASTQDMIETDWKGETPLYQFTLPSDGTLLAAVLSDQGYADGMIYKDAAMTSSLPKASGCSSSRDEIASYELTAGTYYYKAVRWNGQGALDISTFLGFIPKSVNGILYTEIETKYDENTDITPNTYSGREEFQTSLADGEKAVSEDSIETDWKGFSDFHSFSVKESGWLLARPVGENDHINWELFSDRSLMSCIFHGSTLTSDNTEMYACYLNPGTYYYRGNRWNGTGSLSFRTYLGFVPDAPRFSVVSNTLTADASAAQVTFQGETGTIRVIAGEYDPVCIDDKFWAVKNRANVITGNTATITKNGNYVARLETADGLNVMIPFAVSGVAEKTILAPTVSPAPKLTVTPNVVPSAAPSVTTTPNVISSAAPSVTTKPYITPSAAPSQTGTPVKKKVYKITVSKKKLTLKAKQKKTIKYSVTKGYIGFIRMKTSNPRVAVINNKAVITARRKGKCKITFSLSNGKKAVVTVVVKK